MDSSPVAVTYTSDFVPASSKEFLDIQATIECGFTLKRVVTWQEHTVKCSSDNKHNQFFKKFGFTPCKAEQPLRSMELEKKERQKD